MPSLISPDGDVLNLTPSEYEFLRSVHHELTEARNRGQDPVVCLFFEARKKPAGTVFVPPPEPVTVPGADDIASDMPAPLKKLHPDVARDGQADLEDEQEEDCDDIGGFEEEPSAVDDEIVAVLARAVSPLKRIAIIHRSDHLRDNSHTRERLRLLVDSGRVRHLKGHVYWLADRTIPPRRSG